MGKPCINCGQTKGKVYKGHPHDHVCADCGREMPVPDKLPAYSLQSPQFLFVDIGNGYTIKYDGYREKNHWTLLRTRGGRVLDGSFFDVFDVIAREQGCPKCGQRNCLQHGYATTTNSDYIQEEQYATGTARAWICKCCLAHIEEGAFHICPTWENFAPELE